MGCRFRTWCARDVYKRQGVGHTDDDGGDFPLISHDYILELEFIVHGSQALKNRVFVQCVAFHLFRQNQVEQAFAVVVVQRFLVRGEQPLRRSVRTERGLPHKGDDPDKDQQPDDGERDPFNQAVEMCIRDRR